MTREEVEEVMGASEPIQASFEVIGDYVKFNISGEEKVVSIGELENIFSEPCEDCISRADAIANIRILYPDMPIVDIMGARHKWSEKYQQYRDCEKILADLPSIQPKPKTGHWIGHREHCENLGVMPSGLGAYEWCSNCDCGIDLREWHRNNYNFCPNCGAKMLPTDSEKELE